MKLVTRAKFPHKKNLFGKNQVAENLTHKELSWGKNQLVENLTHKKLIWTN